MTETKRRPRSLKGAVLIMVVTILFILIVMLLATLAVVSSSTSRTYTKFEETQAYYTARSALEVYINEMLECKDPATSDYQTAAYNAMVAGGFETPMYNTLGEITGNKIEKDFSKEAKDIDYSFAHQQEIFGYLRPKYQWKGTDFSKKEDSSNWELSSYTEKDYAVEYWAQLPSLTSGAAATKAGKYAGVLSDDLNGDGKNNDVRIKIELLRILYRDEAGNLISDRSGRSSFDNPISTDPADANRISWDNTYYRLKVTATAAVLGSDVDVSVLLEPQPVIAPSGFKNAMTSIKDTNIENQLYVVGGASATASPGTVTNPHNDSQFVGSSVFKGGMKIQVNGSSYPWWLPKSTYYVFVGGPFMTYNSDIVVKGSGDIDGPLDDSGNPSIKLRPYIYADGIAIHGKYGDDTHRLDIIASSKNYTTGTSLYDMSSGTHADNIGFPTGNESNIAFNMGYNSGNEIYGDVYVDGDMYIRNGGGDNCQIFGNVYCTGNIYIDGPAPTIFQGAEIHASAIMDASGNAITDASQYTSTASVESASSFDLTVDQTQPVNNILLPDTLRGDIQISTVKDVTSTYYDGVGNLIPAEDMYQSKAGTDFKLDIRTSGCVITDSIHSQMASSSNVEDVSQDVEVTDSVGNTSTVTYTVNGHHIDPSDTTMFPGAYNSLTGTYDLVFDYDVNWGNTWNGDTNVYIIDTTNGPVHLQFIAKTNNYASVHPTFIFKDENQVTITMQDNRKYEFSQDMGIYNIQLYSMFKNGDTFDVGDFTSVKNVPKAPNILYYIDLPRLERTNAGTGSAWCGYLYAPQTEYFSNSTPGHEITYKYNTESSAIGVFPSNSKKCLHFAGSVVWGKIDGQNDFGALYIKSASGGSSGGAGTGIKWSKQKYLNS